MEKMIRKELDDITIMLPVLSTEIDDKKEAILYEFLIITSRKLEEITTSFGSISKIINKKDQEQATYIKNSMSIIVHLLMNKQDKFNQLAAEIAFKLGQIARLTEIILIEKDWGITG